MNQQQPSLLPVIIGLGTSVPEFKVSQGQALKHITACLGKSEPSLEKLLQNTCIESRYMCNEEVSQAHASNHDRKLQDRLQQFQKEALSVASKACLTAFQQAGVTGQDIGKIVVVSSTGFSGPGLDCQLIKTLGIPRTADRTLIGFMGCAAAMNGLRVARDYVLTHPTKHALMCAIELSSVHNAINSESSLNDLILHAIFADGCAAVVMKAQQEEDVKPGSIVIKDDYSVLAEDTEDGIVLDMKSNGITCTLSKNLPTYIRQNVKPYVDSFLSKNKLKQQDIEYWAIHPGGKRIIESSQEALGLTAADVAPSWKILKHYGNMLSPSIVFVLEEMQRKTSRGLCVAFSFSPGVGIEGLLLQLR